MIQYFSKKINNKKGFTLVELIVVIGILGILAMLAVPKFSKSRADAARAAHNANVRTLESAATLAISEGADVEWSESESDKTKDGGWGNYLQEWPTIPAGLLDEDDKEITETDYTVKVKNGEIEVKPGRIVK